jgi:Fe-S cluster assembly protein SufD
MTTATDLSPQLSALVERAGQPRSGDSEAIAELRERAASRLTDLGFPTPKLELWKHTNPAIITKESLSDAQPIDPGVAASAVAAIGFDGLPQVRRVFVNGRHEKTFDDDGPGLPDGVTIQALTAESAGIVGRLSQVDDAFFAALNAALFTDGLSIHAARGTQSTTPIHIIHVTAGGPTPASVHPRTIVVAEESASISVIESYIRIGDGAVTLTNPATELVTGPNAHIEHSRIRHPSRDDVNIGAVDASVDRDGRVTSHNVSFDSRLQRTDVSVQHIGEGAHAELNGMAVLSETSHVDNHTTMNHMVPNCTTDEAYRYILDGKSRGVFYGRIYVEKDAQKTDAIQNNKNLLLSKSAAIDTMPQLEIYADDVRCTHGATTSRVDPEQLFYLQTRAVPTAEAERMLCHAFAREVLDRLSFPLVRETLERELFAVIDRKTRQEAQDG